MTLSLANLQGSRQPTITSQPQPILIISKLQMVTKCLLHGALQRYYSRLPQRPQVWLSNINASFPGSWKPRTGFSQPRVHTVMVGRVPVGHEFLPITV